MNKISFFALLLFSTSIVHAQELFSPAEFLGYNLGERFTTHHRAVAYFEHVSSIAANVKVASYGETYENRPLIYAVVSSPENMGNLENIRIDNLKRARSIDGIPGTKKLAIVWLSYNVHGNEPSSMEASMLMLFNLADTANEKMQQWLKNTVVIIDPCLNPDGRDRYANFYNQYFNLPANANIDANEHHEPWPTGRSNHYLFDLNRDWAWVTQKESQHRLKLYHEWMPHVHVDFHEQGYNSPYYFAPAAEPYHEVISPWQREFQTIIGRNHANHFDAQGWLYFTKEIFDLYYPSYGDTYPTYNGAVGMTYEQGGGGAGGLKIITKEGDTLKLKDRITHHLTSGVSTVEMASQQASRLVDEFEKYFRENTTTPSATYKAYIIKKDNNSDKLKELTRWMDVHKIRYGHPASAKSLRGFNYQTQLTSAFNLTTDDLVVNIFQPQSRFITTVFEPQSKLPDSLTYDITAWNLMYAYNLKAYAVTERINVQQTFQENAHKNIITPEKPYAYIIKYQSVQDVAFLAELMKRGIKVRASSKAFTLNGENFDPGTLLVTRRNNENVNSFDEKVQSVANALKRKVYASSTGFVSKGKDLGAEEVRYLKPPKVALLIGPETSSRSVGEIWHFFEQQIHYPVTQISTGYFDEVELSKYSVLLIPDGTYKMMHDDVLDRIGTWVSKGGKLIIISRGLQAFTDKKGFSLKIFSSDGEKIDAERKEKLAKEKEVLTRYEDAERKEISNVISGAIYKISMDSSHPLAFGIGSTYYSLKTHELRYAFLDKGWNVGVIRGTPKPVQGFAGKHINKQMENSLVFGVEEKGDGHVVYMIDNPLFRSFWATGKLVFSNAVFMVGQ